MIANVKRQVISSGDQTTGRSEAKDQPTPSPEELLHALRQKQTLFKVLSEEGLINKDRYANIKTELSKAIQDLEELV